MGHPDDIGQTVAAIMNAFISDTDVLQVDDIAGVLTNYGRPGPAPGATGSGAGSRS